MPDMLVNLYKIEETPLVYEEVKQKGIQIKRALPPDKQQILTFVRENFGAGWESECDCSFANQPSTCYIAIKDKKVIGFACYDATAKDFFGPTGVLPDERGQGIGKALLLKCLHSLKEAGYGYAIIGWVGPADFYEKVCGATIIPSEGAPSVYERMISQN